MSATEQMYCTHCTHGSSALERSQGELAARMLGYSVRAGSLEGEALKQVYRQVERYVSYHLPRDTPGQQKLQLTASTAPRRLIFLPAAGSWQVIGQVCYRQRDTEGRPGSYFAHLLCRQAGSEQESWTLLDALRLWNAPGWVTEDSADHPFVLPRLDGLDSLLAGEGARIDDRALLAFLRGDDRSFGSHLPDRWRDLLPRRRVTVLQNILSALLTTGTTRRQTLLVAVEPEMAALLFYGVGRLLPAGKLRASASMSTFEATTDRLTTALAATTFCTPATAEFSTEALRGRGIALNTFGDSWNGRENAAAYAETTIQRLLDEGPEAVDRRLAMIAAAGPERIEALEDFTRTEQAVATLFQSVSASDESWRSDGVLANFARSLTQERLGSLAGDESTLNRICGGASHTAILDLVTMVAPGSGMDRGIRFLLEKLPEEKVAPLVANGEIDDAWKIELLQSRIGAKGKAPAGCEWIWDEEGHETPLSSDRRRAIALGLMGGISATAVVSMLGGLDASRRLVAVERLLDASDRDSARWAVFAEVVRRLDVDSMIALWRKMETRFFEVPELVGKVVAERLRALLNALHEHPAEFSQRLEFLEAGHRWLTDPDDSSRLAAWARCREAIVELVGMKESAGGWHQLTASRRLESAAQRMTESALEAMPAARFEDDRQGSAKQERLRAIGRQLAGGDEFLPKSQWQNEAIWKKIGWRFEMGSWPSVPLRKLARGVGNRKQLWIAVAIAAAVVLGTLGVIGLATFGTGSKEPENLVVERGERPVRTETETIEEVPSAEGVSSKPDGPPNGAASTEPRPAVPAEDPAAEPVVSEPIVFTGDPPEAEATTAEESSTEAVMPKEPLVPIDGTFAADMSAVAGLKRPAVAVIGLHVRGVDGKPLPDWVLTQYTIGALVQEQGDVREARYLDFVNLSEQREAELLDGVERVLVQFRFVRRLAAPLSEPSGIAAASHSWAEVPIEPAQRYDIRFILSPAAITELERLAEVRD